MKVNGLFFPVGKPKLLLSSMKAFLLITTTCLAKESLVAFGNNATESERVQKQKVYTFLWKVKCILWETVNAVINGLIIVHHWHICVTGKRQEI